MSVMISILILTKDEELDLPGCLASISWCDDIHVIDSGSIDNTIEIAQQHAARIQLNAFQSFAQQRNWALDHCDVKHEWILFLDADERSTDSFRSAVFNAIDSAPPSFAGFYCCWKTILDGRWLKRCDNFPKWQFRLLRRGRARFCDSGHGQKEGAIDGCINYIPEPYLHYAFSRGWEHWTLKHRRYAMKDAAAILEQQLSIGSLFSSHGSMRNAAIKRLVRQFPGWPQLRFFYSYFLKAGFLEGKEGLSYCRKMLWYERQVRSQLLVMQNLALQPGPLDG